MEKEERVIMVAEFLESLYRDAMGFYVDTEPFAIRKRLTDQEAVKWIRQHTLTPENYLKECFPNGVQPEGTELSERHLLLFKKLIRAIEKGETAQPGIDYIERVLDRELASREAQEVTP